MNTKNKDKLNENLILSESLKASIQRGLEQSKMGIGSVHEEVMKKFRSKIKKGI